MPGRYLGLYEDAVCADFATRIRAIDNNL